MLSKAGLGSRTQARAWIAAGRVRVNGRRVTDPDTWVDPQRDQVALDGEPIQAAQRIYLALHKPAGYVTTRRDEKGRPTVYTLLRAGSPYLFSIGRLDLDSSGLLLLTNDAVFAERIASPDQHVPKTYRVTVPAPIHDDQLEALRRGMMLNDGPTRPARVRRLSDADGSVVLEITITEGRNRQIRRMLEAVDSAVLGLERTAIGPLGLGGLPAGASRPLTSAEVARLSASARPARTRR